LQRLEAIEEFMKGDSIIVEEHHRKAASGVAPAIMPMLAGANGRYTLSVAGQSGAGKSETALAIAQALEARGVNCIILQQDDYFVHPPKTNDATRRADIKWVGTQEVHLDLMDEHLKLFLDGATRIEKPLVDYDADTIGSETLEPGSATVAIADGTYTTLLKNALCHVFIDRDYNDTRAHREKRLRHKSELDPFIDEVLQIEHEIISAHKELADIIINSDYSVTVVDDSLAD
jgi:uridine kinase